MAISKKLGLALLTASSLLFFYILCLHLEIRVVPLKHFQSFVQGGSSDSQQTDSDLGTQLLPFSEKTQTEKTNTDHKPAESNDVLDVLKSSSRPVDGSEKTKTKTGTKAPTPKPQQPTQAAGTTAPAYIGDSYMKEDIPAQTTCPDGVRSRIAGTEFGERFLATIPILQWGKHVTPEEHQRLSRYPGSHGWSETSIDLLKETLSTLNSSANWLLLDDWKDRSNKSECIRCAVVGNGGILKDSKKGAEIDGHDYVFRTNGALIQGFEQDVGSRTTHYTFSINTMRNSLGSYRKDGFVAVPMSKETRYVFVPDHDRDYLMVEAAATHTLVKAGREQGKDATNFFGKDVTAEKLKMYHPDFIRYLRNRFLRSKILKGRWRNAYRPTTGAVMLLAALHACDKVSAYGFITPDYMKYSDHYYDKIYHKVAFYINHDMRMELGLWQKLNQAGLIQLYMHDLEQK